MPKQGTLKDRSRFVHSEMKRVHPEIAWGVTAEIGTTNETVFMWRCTNTS